MTEIPCSIQEMTDEEAVIQLIIGNIQTENHPLEIGLNALQVVKKDSKKGFSQDKPKCIKSFIKN